MERRQRDLVLIVARSFADKLATPALVADEDGNVVYANEAATAASLEAEPLPLEEIALRERRPAHGSVAVTTPDGERRELGVTAFPLLSHPDELVGVMAIFWEPVAVA